MKLLKQLVAEIREEDAAPFCLSVKLRSGDDVNAGGLFQGEAQERRITFRSGVAVAWQLILETLD